MSFSHDHTNYERDGYILARGMYEERELMQVRKVLVRFHSAWRTDNAEHYQSGVVNSAYITGKKYLDERDRQVLFEFIGSTKIAQLLQQVLPKGAMFIGTQLFFDPARVDKKNYWHRDIQYNKLTTEEQKASLRTSTPLHLRIALKPERGVELVPGSHYQWDSNEEFDVRMQRNSHKVFDDLDTGRAVALESGDALLFSAAMIHRGLYGGDRFAFDLLFANVDQQFASFVDVECLPDEEQVNTFEWPDVFLATMRLKHI